jgi:hypothetical protein
MEARGYNQYELSSRTDGAVDQSRISYLLAGKKMSRLSAIVVVRLARALKLPVAWLLVGEGADPIKGKGKAAAPKATRGRAAAKKAPKKAAKKAKTGAKKARKRKTR